MVDVNLGKIRLEIEELMDLGVMRIPQNPVYYNNQPEWEFSNPNKFYCSEERWIEELRSLGMAYNNPKL